ncbi:hypothetical protein AURDEDRAFT_177735 [Auricularia subglabra TFB-10046 SS5]|uniref:Uncharacterized protein n=1 Tax=Auricularia subglabra (strain TFB-10046 / SS5) TaxID=717982 RepID=J0D3C6_AURST|nr:hypothetical protein AURDEDRAFT_177735 [Auricularia subglabra TFB-10046 SS5]
MPLPEPRLLHAAQLDNFHDGHINALAFSKNAAMLVTCGDDGYLCVFDLRTIKAICAIQLDSRVKALCIEWMADNCSFCVGLSNGRVCRFMIGKSGKVVVQP